MHVLLELSDLFLALGLSAVVAGSKLARCRRGGRGLNLFGYHSEVLSLRTVQGAPNAIDSRRRKHLCIKVLMVTLIWKRFLDGAVLVPTRP